MKADPKNFKYGIQCKSCKEEIYSPNRHSLVECGCKKCYIDGGDDYMRIGGKKGAFTYCAISRKDYEERLKEKEKKDGNKRN